MFTITGEIVLRDKESATLTTFDVATAIFKLFDKYKEYLREREFSDDEISDSFKHVKIKLNSIYKTNIDFGIFCCANWPKQFNPEWNVVFGDSILPDFVTLSFDSDAVSKSKEKDKINPDHYKNQTSLECIEAMELMFGHDAIINFCLCNAYKYIWRWKNKNGAVDLDKADWYLERAYSMLSSSDERMKDLSRMLHYIRLYNIKKVDDDEREEV